MSLSVERKLNKHATTILIGGLFLSMSLLFYLAFCSMPCDDPTYGISRSDLRDAQNKAFWNGHILAPSRDLSFPQVVLVMSAPDNLMGRDTIRETWARDLPKTTLLRFVIGTGSLSAQQHSNTHRENFIHSDLLLLKSVNDSYETLTLKLLESFKWLDRHVEFTHLIKADEDSFVRVDRLAYELQKKPKERFYWGFFDGRAHVKKAGKWAEKEWILCDRYLPYALGGGYVLSADLVHYVSSNSKYLKLFNSEDVSLGAWLGPLDIKRSHDARFDTEYKSRESQLTVVGAHGNYSWPERDKAVHVDGDLVLGALHMVHERSEDKICGPIMPQGGIQALETMLYTLDIINANQKLLPGVTLGVLAKDDCDRDIYGLEQAVDFIRGSIANIGGSEYKCHDGSDPIIPGVIGAPSSGFNELEKLLKASEICIAATEKLIKDSGVAGEATYDKTVERLLAKSNARGVIVFGSDQEVGELMHAVRRKNASRWFSWIGSDGWGGRSLAVDGNEVEVEGAVTVQPLAFEVKGFKDYFLNLTPRNNKRNPWFVEFWEQQFRCKYPGSNWTPYNDGFNVTCSGNERIFPQEFEMEAQLQFVSDAIMSFAHAFTNMLADFCGDVSGLCDAMMPIDGELLKDYLVKVNFTGLSGQQFAFLPNGDAPARYRILNYRQVTRGRYEWKTIGFFLGKHLFLDSQSSDRIYTMEQMVDMKFRWEEPKHPESVCSRPCQKGEAHHMIDGSACCWTCSPCHLFQYLPTKYACVDCPSGTIPSFDRQHCVEIPIIYLRYTDAIALVAMAFASLGIIATAVVMVIFILYNDTPVVKASGRELSFVLLFGIFMCYAMTFILVSKPSEITCGAQKYCIGLSFSIIYSAILTKTNRISRIFRAGKRTSKRPRFISPRSQLFICGAFVAFQNAVGIVWLLLRPPRAVSYHADRDDHQLVCNDAVGAWYMVGFTYPIVLVIICTFYAILTRNIPEAFNESKYIGFTMYTTCIIWLAFVSIYFSTEHNIHVRIATMSFSISLSATVGLICMFATKLYIIILHPERNVRQSLLAAKPVMPSPKLNNCYSSIHSSYHSNGRQDTAQSVQSDYGDMEMMSRLRPSSSFSSTISRSTCATQTLANGTSISTQTLEAISRGADDVQL
ncbi:metabotropic glutamate receptor-like [Saccostrea echinata]|uniref:metabotropic glutamate receptor-like n=1 Tax=Saccostrea echinata TaxID=191078 RepID=UPI002A8072E6|nr:metabotropic glutamate receptor-like [Saccostrea echinata]